MKETLIKTEIRLLEGETLAHSCHSISDKRSPRMSHRVWLESSLLAGHLQDWPRQSTADHEQQLPQLVLPIFRRMLQVPWYLCSWKLACVPKHSLCLSIHVFQELVNILLKKLDLAAPFCKVRVWFSLILHSGQCHLDIVLFFGNSKLLINAINSDRWKQQENIKILIFKWGHC